MRLRKRASLWVAASWLAVFVGGSLMPGWTKWVPTVFYVRDEAREEVHPIPVDTSLWGALQDLIRTGDWQMWVPGESGWEGETGPNFTPTVILFAATVLVPAVVYWLLVRRLPPDGAEDYGEGRRGSAPPG